MAYSNKVLFSIMIFIVLSPNPLPALKDSNMTQSQTHTEQAKKEEVFALELVKQLKKTKQFKGVLYDKENNEIDCDGAKIYTSNIFKDYQKLPPKKQREFISDLAKNLKAIVQNDNIPYKEAVPLLMPLVRERFHFESRKLYLQKNRKDKDASDIPYLLLNEHLAVGLTLNTKNAITTLSNKIFKNWKVDFKEALESALENLRSLDDAPFEEVYPGVWVSPWKDSYDPSRLLIPNMIHALKTKGDPIVFLPNRDSLIVVGSEDIEGFKKAIELVYEGIKSHRSATGRTFILRNDKLEEFNVPKEHPFYHDLNLLKKFSIEGEYYEQTHYFGSVLDDDDTMVSECTLIQPDNELPFTMSMLSKGFVTYLPETDRVFLSNGTDIEQNDDIFNSRLVDFEKFKQVCGHHMELIETYPKRYLVKQFPSEKELKAMGVK